MFDKINTKIQLNVDRELVKELFEEIEGYVSLCVEMENQRSSLKFLNSISENFFLSSLRIFLIDKLKNDQIKVEKMFIENNPSTLDKNIYVKIFVPNIWAIEYGNDYKKRLDDTISFFKNQQTEPVKSIQPIVDQTDFRTDMLTRCEVPTNPSIGSLYYDDQIDVMKMWTGSRWRESSL